MVRGSGREEKGSAALVVVAHVSIGLTMLLSCIATEAGGEHAREVLFLFD